MPFWGIDPSISNTGVVILGEGGDLLACHDGKNFVTDKHAEPIIRYLQQAEGICSLFLSDCARSGKNVLVYEDYSFNSEHKAYSLAEYGGTLKSCLYRASGETPILCAPTTAKKFATGSGLADKDSMVAAALEACPELGGENLSTDIADAFFLALIGFFAYEPAAAIRRFSGHPLLRLRLELAMELKPNGEAHGKKRKITGYGHRKQRV